MAQPRHWPVSPQAAHDLASELALEVQWNFRRRDRDNETEEAFSGLLAGVLAGAYFGGGWLLEVAEVNKHHDESRIGADLRFLLTVQDGGDIWRKGLLIQAKNDYSLGNRERDRLTEQCKKMLDVTPDAAFVAVYGSPRTQTGVWLLSAADVVRDGGAVVFGGSDLFGFLYSFFVCITGSAALGDRIQEDPTLGRPRRAIRMTMTRT